MRSRALTNFSLLAATISVLLAVRAAAKADKPTDAEVKQLIGDLGDPDVPRRYRAAKRLTELGRPAVAALRKAAAGHPSDDVRDRAAIVLKDVEKAGLSVARVYEGHTSPTSDWRHYVTRVAVTPDGKRMLSCNGHGMILWDVESGHVVRQLGEPGRNNWALALSRDGKRAIGGGNDRTARVWDLDTGREVQKLAGHTEPVWGVALTADGRTAITGARDRAIIVWDVATGKEVRSFKGVPDRVRALALSPDEKLVAVGHFEKDDQPGTLRLWNLAEGKQVYSREGHAKPITYVAFSRDGKTILTAGHDGTVRFWDTATGKETKKLVMDGCHTEFAALSQDGNTLVCGGTEAEASIRLWDVPSATEIYASEPVPEGFLGGVILPDGYSAVVACRDGFVRQWRWK